MAQFILVLALGFSQMLMAADYGTFFVVKGKVSIEGASGIVEAKEGSKIQVGETVITGADSRAKIVMFDRNIVNVSPNTKLKFEKYTNSKDDRNVKLKLIEGKVRNKVEVKYDNKSSRFEIRTATAVAGVRGTDFVTSYDPVTKITEIVTFRGEVSFTSLAENSPDSARGEPVLVGKGEKSQSKGIAVSEPAKVPAKELNQVDSETDVKDKDGKGKDSKDKKDKNRREKGKKEESNPDEADGINNQPPVVEPSLNTINNPNNPITQKPSPEKSSVKIITQPAN